MRRFLRAAAVAAAATLLATPATGYALLIAMKPPAQRAVTAEAIVVGKVAGFDKDTVEAPSPFPGAKDKLKYKIATVKVETGLAGADKLTEVKVGFVPPVKPDPKAKPPAGVPVRPIRPNLAVELKEGQELLLFLTKHPAADFYIIPTMSPPVDLKDDQGKKDLEAVKKVVATLADPMKGLKSTKPEVRAETATALVMKYRAFPEFGGQVEQKPIDAEESKLILKALAEADWHPASRGGPQAALNPIQAFYALGLNEKDTWVPPVVARTPGGPPVDFTAVQKDAFTKWLDGPGKNYVVKRNVPKAKP